MRILSSSRGRIALYLTVMLAILVWDLARRHWSPARTLETRHYTVCSTAAADTTRDIGLAAEITYAAYARLLADLKLASLRHGRLRVRLYKDRDEFVFCGRVNGWAEAYYRWPYCNLYCTEEEPNPYHWLVHEAVHQLNAEVAGLSLPQWLNEGLATYFGSSMIVSNRLELGATDTNTYPAWWIDAIAASGDLEKDKAGGSVIPLRAIVSGRGGPDLDQAFNLYYVHWWTLMHFLMRHDGGRGREGLARLIKSKGDVEAFERNIGSIEAAERQWYEHVLALKSELRRRKTPKVTLQATSEVTRPGGG